MQTESATKYLESLPKKYPEFSFPTEFLSYGDGRKHIEAIKKFAIQKFANKRGDHLEFLIWMKSVYEFSEDLKTSHNTILPPEKRELDFIQNELKELIRLVEKNVLQETISGLSLEFVFKDQEDAVKILKLLRVKGIISSDHKWIGFGKTLSEVLALIEVLNDKEYLRSMKPGPRAKVFRDYFGIQLTDRSLRNQASTTLMEEYDQIIPSRDKLASYN